MDIFRRRSFTSSNPEIVNRSAQNFRLHHLQLVEAIQGKYTDRDKANILRTPDIHPAFIWKGINGRARFEVLNSAGVDPSRRQNPLNLKVVDSPIREVWLSTSSSDNTLTALLPEEDYYRPYVSLYNKRSGLRLDMNGEVTTQSRIASDMINAIQVSRFSETEREQLYKGFIPDLGELPQFMYAVTYTMRTVEAIVHSETIAYPASPLEDDMWVVHPSIPLASFVLESNFADRPAFYLDEAKTFDDALGRLAR